jgi:hypothetical protein
LLKKLIQKLAARTGYAVVNTRNRYMQDGVFTIHNDDFRRDPVFAAAYLRGIKASHGVNPQFEWRVHIALWAASMALALPGDFVECGVNAGFISSALMEGLNWNKTNKRFYLIDTFSGPVLTQFSAEEVQRGRRKIAEEALGAGAYVTDLQRVRANYAEWPEAVVVQGTVPDVLPTLEIEQVAFLHIDMNCAYPERMALEYFWNRLSPGAMVLLDDYAYFGHERQAEAMDEAAKLLGVPVLSLPTGQGLLMKPAAPPK